jgi:hypothetical protein
MNYDQIFIHPSNNPTYRDGLKSGNGNSEIKVFISHLKKFPQAKSKI